MLQNQNSSILHGIKCKGEWHLLKQQVRTEKAQQPHLHTEISLLCMLNLCVVSNIQHASVFSSSDQQREG